MSRESFIEAMRGVAHSVCVVTTNGKSGKSGATVSAFCSVSADPPTALICLNLESRIAQEVLVNAVFNINILPIDAVHTANRFAGMHDDEVEDRFDGIEITNSDVPVLKGASVFRCEVQESMTAGSHRVVIGRVVESVSITRNPLTYLEGAYHRTVPLTR